jgi:serine/threonine protein phosphatase 1
MNNKAVKPFFEFDQDLGRVFVIGDIHGTLPELEILLNHLKDKEKLQKSDRLICVGDYIDRGYDTKRVVDLLIQFKNEFPLATFLRGNHEDMFLHYLGFDGILGENFIINGGNQTLISYGINPALFPAEVLTQFPPQHLSFFLNLERYAVSKDYMIVHAGFNPLLPLDQQKGEDIFWIRDEFIMSAHPFNKTVIFGHTPFRDILFHLPYKIGIDTGLVYGNILTCLELTEKKILQIKVGKKRAKVSSFKNR